MALALVPCSARGIFSARMTACTNDEKFLLLMGAFLHDLGKVEELTLEVSRAKQQLEAAKGRADEFEDKYRAMFRERQRLE